MEEIKFFEYPACSTCKKAKKFLNENKISFEDIHIVENPPEEKELEEIYKNSNLDIKKFFNTSGLVYKEMGLKDLLPKMSENEKINLLASNGKLIKRPLLVKGKKVLVEFKEEDWKTFLKID